MQRFITTCIALLAVTLFSSFAFAQRGTGEPYGIVRSGENPEVVTLSGELVEIFSGACENTTRYAVIGTHLHIRDANGQILNVHLGPEQSMATVSQQLKVGEPISFEAYRTDRLAENAYVAVSLKQGDTSLRLRDESLQPFWARSVSGGRGRGAYGRGYQAYGRRGDWGYGGRGGRTYHRRGGRRW